MQFQLPYFDSIDTSNLEEEYRTYTDFNGRSILLDLNFTKKEIEVSTLELLVKQINRIAAIDIENRNEIESESKSGFVVKDYIDDSMEMLEKEDLKIIMKNVDKTKSKKQQLFDALFLNRVGFYPENEELCIICDYTYSEELLDELLVVSRKIDGSFTSLQVES